MKSSRFVLSMLLLGIFLSACGATASPSSASSAPAVSAGGPAVMGQYKQLGDAINLVNGTDTRPSVYSSYHIELNVVNPSLADDGKSIITKSSKITADVQGKNIHLFYTGVDGTTSEGYIIGDKEYKMVDGKPQEMLGQIAVTWAFWPLNAFGYNAAAQFALLSGNDTFENRPVVKYIVDSSKFSQEQLNMLTSSGMFPFTYALGSVTIDQQTNGLIATNIDFKENIYDANAEKVVGVGDGHVEIAISKIDQVTVNLP